MVSSGCPKQVYERDVISEWVRSRTIVGELRVRCPAHKREASDLSIALLSAQREVGGSVDGVRVDEDVKCRSMGGKNREE
jgi:hypothetical protein